MSLLDLMPESRHDLHVRLTVTYYRKTSNAPNTYATGASVANCWREATRADQGGNLLAEQLTWWNVYTTALTSAGISQAPKPGDVVEFQGSRFMARDVEQHERDSRGIQRYRLGCIKER